MVEDALYRSGQPNELNFPFMERLQLKKIIFLASEEPSRPLCVGLALAWPLVLRRGC